MKFERIRLYGGLFEALGISDDYYSDVQIKRAA